MVHIEQAIFASRRTDHAAGYHLVVTSDGVSSDDAHALTVWGPSHDSLLASPEDEESINFHPLPSGAYCISRTRRAGTEYSGRGEEVYTHCLVVPAEGLAKFSNNPFALVRAAIVDGRLDVLEAIPRELPGFVLRGKASPVDRRLICEVVADLGAEKFAALIDAVLNQSPLAVITSVSARHVMDAVLNCLPVDCRPAISFATGLKPSPRRPFRMQLFPSGTEELRHLLRPLKVAVLDLTATEAGATPGGWAQTVTAAIVEKRFRILSEELGNPCGGFDAGTLKALTLRLEQRLGEADESQRGDRRSRSRRHGPSARSSHSNPQPPSSCTPRDSASARLNHRGDAAHQRSASQQPTAALVEDEVDIADLRSDPSQQLGKERPDIIERLELLDDTVFEAIAGKPAALEHLRLLWPETLSMLGIEHLEESREQYLRHAKAVWEHCAKFDGVRKSEQSLAALSVISLLLE